MPHTPGEGRFTTADKLTPGNTILERTERGTIRVRAKVQETSRCSDKGNVHVRVQLLSVRGEKTWCYFGNTPVEIVA